MSVSGWGRFPRIDGPVVRLRDPIDARRRLASTPSLIARGNGRSYGDPALSGRLMLETLACDRLIAFDPAAATVTCEAGLLLGDLIGFCLPRGFFPAIVPGTRYVTIGGMIAADIHGKNHHSAGSLSGHVLGFDLMLADGSVRHVTRTSDARLFDATCGGMGLTGLILSATLRLIRVASPWLDQETLRAPTLDVAIDLCEASQSHPYTAAWIDCVSGAGKLGRSLIYRARHGAAGGDTSRPKRDLAIPFDLPGFLLNHWSVRAFNELYWRLPRPTEGPVDWRRFFFPLDGIRHWNRLYGSRGFTQYQCVLPLEASRAGLRLLLERIGEAGTGSFLAVLKRCGAAAHGPLSFPLEGYTLALDFPATAATWRLLDELDAITLDHGGRLYLAKDARQSPATLRRGYPRVDRFLEVREAVDPGRKFASLQSARLGL